MYVLPLLSLLLGRQILRLFTILKDSSEFRSSGGEVLMPQRKGAEFTQKSPHMWDRNWHRHRLLDGSAPGARHQLLKCLVRVRQAFAWFWLRDHAAEPHDFCLPRRGLGENLNIWSQSQCSISLESLTWAGGERSSLLWCCQDTVFWGRAVYECAKVDGTMGVGR